MLLSSKSSAFGLVIFLFLTISTGVVLAQQSKVLELAPTDDAYVVSDLNDPSDRLGLQTLGTGDFKFLKVWYAWNVTAAPDKKIVSLAYLNFDLFNLSRDEVNSAKLKMHAQNATLTGVSRLVDIHVANMVPWKESALVYKIAPSFSINSTASSSISLSGKWYEWDLTDAVKERAGSRLTVTLLFQKLLNGHEEQVVFSSKEADDHSLRPRLAIESIIPASSVSVSSEMMPLIAAVAAGIAAAGGAAGFLFYRRRQRLTSQVSSQDTSRVAARETALSPEETRALEYSCPNCGKKISKDFNICPYCENDLTKIKCPSCGKDISRDYKICPYCGSKSNL